MITRRTATAHRNSLSCSALTLCMAWLVGAIGIPPAFAFAEPDVHHRPLEESMSSVELAIEFQGFLVVRDQIKSDGRRYLTASHPATGLNLSIAMEPIEGTASAAGCVDRLRELRRGPAVSRGQDIVLTTAPAVQTLHYTLHRVHGLRLDQKSLYACMAEGHVYASLHLSKIRHSADDNALFERVIHSIHLRPSHLQPVTIPPVGTPLFQTENVSYTKDGSVHAIAP
ncbi:MAG: hypothetical protein GDA68_12920 [Nitrospira sp. CR2.1]|nr:hypothetical protein [Nitrospira sp. CR2.1]